MKTTLGIEFELFFPQISHRAKIGFVHWGRSGDGTMVSEYG